MTRLSHLACLAAISLAPLPAFAAQWTPAQGCNLELTVQSADCTVTQYFNCEADAEGIQHLLTFDEDGPVWASMTDSEGRWLLSLDLLNKGAEQLITPGGDPSSMTELLEYGRDDVDFETRDLDGQVFGYRGWDRLTGRTQTIDSVDLEVTEFMIEMIGPDGEILVTRNGRQFLDPVTRRFFGGIEKIAPGDDVSMTIDASPRRFVFPDETGFGETTPQYGCSLELAQLSLGKTPI